MTAASVRDTCAVPGTRATHALAGFGAAVEVHVVRSRGFATYGSGRPGTGDPVTGIVAMRPGDRDRAG